VDFDLERFKRDAGVLNPDMTVMLLSAKEGTGVPEWVDWLKTKLAEKRSR
jgi:Ni2+-binding GTPase involved in maturation of urease and hydrogenase